MDINDPYQAMLAKLAEIRPPNLNDSSCFKSASDFLKVFCSIVDPFVDSYGEQADYLLNLSKDDRGYFKDCLLVSLEGNALFILDNGEETMAEQARERREIESEPGYSAAVSAGVD